MFWVLLIIFKCTSKYLFIYREHYNLKEHTITHFLMLVIEPVKQSPGMLDDSHRAIIVYYCAVNGEYNVRDKGRESQLLRGNVKKVNFVLAY